MKKLLKKLSGWSQKFKHYTKTQLSDEQLIQEQLRESLSILNSWCGEDELQGIIYAQGAKRFFAYQCDLLTLQQMPGLIQAAQHAFGETTGECKILWKEATLFNDDEGVLTIEVVADAFDQKTEQFLTSFFVIVPVEDAIKGDVEYLTGLLREAMDNMPTTDDQADTKGVTLH